MKTSISIIIPTYNVEKYVTECLNSLINQSFKNFEIIIVDDCSTDSTLDIVKYFACLRYLYKNFQTIFYLSLGLLNS